MRPNVFDLKFSPFTALLAVSVECFISQPQFFWGSQFAGSAAVLFWNEVFRFRSQVLDETQGEILLQETPETPDFRYFKIYSIRLFSPSIRAIDNWGYLYVWQKIFQKDISCPIPSGIKEAATNDYYI